jgi:signal transduction histidine kinase
VSAALALLTVVAGAGLVAAMARERRVGELVAQASHELRGPLAAARLGLHGLGEEDSARLAAIDLELRRAALALDDLAAAPRRRRAGERRAPVDVGELLREAGEAWRAVAAARDVALVVEPPPGPVLVQADPLRLAQAFGNLAANAIEHGGGTVRVRVRPAAAGHARIEFTDAGPGLPAPVAELVASARGRRARRGHGLALAAGIAERHGGRLTSAPSPAGARLVLELPCAAAPLSGDRPRRRRRRRAR